MIDSYELVGDDFVLTDSEPIADLQWIYEVAWTPELSVYYGETREQSEDYTSDSQSLYAKSGGTELLVSLPEGLTAAGGIVVAGSDRFGVVASAEEDNWANRTDVVVLYNYVPNFVYSTPGPGSWEPTVVPIERHLEGDPSYNYSSSISSLAFVGENLLFRQRELTRNPVAPYDSEVINAVRTIDSEGNSTLLFEPSDNHSIRTEGDFVFVTAYYPDAEWSVWVESSELEWQPDADQPRFFFK